MQTLLNDIELDIQELKCLIQAISTDANPTLRIVAERNIRQMRARLDALQKQLTPSTESFFPTEPTVSDAMKTVREEPEAVQSIVPSASPILAERIKPAKDLRHAISLNDSFRFVRELFAGDAVRMNEVIRRLSEVSSLDEAMDIFTSEVHPDKENEAAADFQELLKKHFN